MLWLKNKTFLLFIALLIHITLLDFVVVTYNGAIFLIDENIALKTIITHLVIVCSSVAFYYGLNNFLDFYRQSNYKTSDYMWITWSVFLILIIGFLLI